VLSYSCQRKLSTVSLYTRRRGSVVDVLGPQSQLLEKAVDSLAACLQDGDWIVISNAVKVLQAQSKLSERAVDSLAACLLNRDWGVVSSAVNVLVPRIFLDVILSLVHDGNFDVKQDIFGALNHWLHARLTSSLRHAYNLDSFVQYSLVHQLSLALIYSPTVCDDVQINLR